MTGKPGYVVRILALALMASSLCLDGAVAAAPRLEQQAPGYYRLMLGAFEITALSDGVFDLDTESTVTNLAPARRRELLASAFEGDHVPTSVNAYLINTGSRLILVDAGAADRFGPSLGRLHANLRASGYRPEQVDDVLLTHLHPDHVGGLLQDGRSAFPNAALHVELVESQYWLSGANLELAPPDRKAFFEGAAAAIEPYRKAGRFVPFSGAADLFPGVRAIPAPGHTPGHTLYEIESGGEKLVLWGDLMEIAAIQFTEPSATIVFDSDGPAAAAQRPRAYADAAKARCLIGVSHLPFPGIGHLRAEGAGFVWVPIAPDRMR